MVYNVTNRIIYVQTKAIPMICILNLISSYVKRTYFLVIKLSLFANKNQASVTSYINMLFWTGIIECMFKKEISLHERLVVHDENHGIHITIIKYRKVLE